MTEYEVKWSIVDNTPENREKLAQAVVEDMSIGDIMEFTFHNLVKLYSTNTDAFNQDCENYGFPEEDSQTRDQFEKFLKIETEHNPESRWLK